MDGAQTRCIGKIVSSNSHIDYVCHVFGRAEVRDVPRPDEYRLGTWVGVPVDESGDSLAIGLVYDTQLYNPDYGTFGPRLSSQSQMEVFSPDYLNETAVLVGVLTVGQMGEDFKVSGLCPLAPTVGAEVRLLSADQVRSFHTEDERFQIGYYGLLLALQHPVMPMLLQDVLGGLERLLPEHARTINALKTNLAWRNRVAVLR